MKRLSFQIPLLLCASLISCHTPNILTKEKRCFYGITMIKNERYQQSTYFSKGHVYSKISYSYRDDGKLLQVQFHDYSSDSTSLLLEINSSYVFYENGNIKRRIDQYNTGYSMSTHFLKYNADGRVLEQRHFFGLDSNGRSAVVKHKIYTYDSLGRTEHVEQTDSNRTWNTFYYYNKRGSVRMEKTSISDSLTNSFYTRGIKIDSFRYTYDLAGRVKKKFVIKPGIDSLVEKRKYR